MKEMQDVNLIRNLDLRDEIKAYWSLRAETFDLQAGHEIFSEAERQAWLSLISRHLGEGGGRHALDLACGTAVVSHLLDDLGFRVSGLDWSEPMLQRARTKAKSRGRQIRFLMGDAENTMEPDAAYDVITNRHLVWTLVDPLSAFREWHRVLKPSGKVLIVDGDFVNQGRLAAILKRMSSMIEMLSFTRSKPPHGPVDADMARTHAEILSRVYFSQGARAEAVAELLEQAEFSNIVVDYDMRAIHKTQRQNFSPLKSLERSMQHRYAISAEKPE